jgi:hypothetical protein
MAPDKILHPGPESQGQGLIRYLSQASDISRGNFQLQELGRAANARSGLFALVQRWVRAYALDPQKLPVQAAFKREFYSLFDELAQAHGQMWALALVSQDQQARAALPPPVSEHLPAAPQGNLPRDVTLLDPFFRPREESNAIRGEQTVSQRNVGAAYYARYGCVRCDRKDEPHESNGFCHNCHHMIVSRRKGLLEGKGKYGDFGA